MFSFLKKRKNNKNKIALHVITMYRDEELERLLKESKYYVDIVRVCDGSGEESTKKICKKYNAQYFYRKWDDKFQEQDNVLLDKAKEGEWILIMDDDEIPSVPLFTNLRNLVSYANKQNFNMISLPCILSLDGEMECSVEEFISDVKNKKRKPFRKFWLFKKDDSVRSYGTPHRLVETELGWKVFDQPNPYIHYKTRIGFLMNDCVHSFINQQDQHYTLIEANKLKNAIKETNWKYSTDVIPGLESSNIPNKLKDFMWEYKDEIHRPISRWFWVYYFIFNRKELPKDFPYHLDISWKGYKEYIQK